MAAKACQFITKFSGTTLAGGSYHRPTKVVVPFLYAVSDSTYQLVTRRGARPGARPGGEIMGRIIGYIVLGIVAVIVALAVISIAGSIIGLVISLLKILLKLAVLGVIGWFAWQVYERVRRQA